VGPQRLSAAGVDSVAVSATGKLFHFGCTVLVTILTQRPVAEPAEVFAFRDWGKKDAVPQPGASAWPATST